MHDIKLIPAGEKDVAVIAELAKIIWHQHYPGIIGIEQVNYMLSRSYSHDSLVSQMKEKKHQYYFVVIDGKREGFVSINREAGNSWYLNKFYINQEKAGNGAGSRVFEMLFEIMQPAEVLLNVNRANYKSINFYFKHGFRIKELKVFNIGNGYVMDDFVMEWKKK